MTKQQTIAAIRAYFRQHPAVERASLFGSFARGQHTPTSDIDLLVHFRETVDFFTLANIRLDLCEITQRKIDILTEKSLSEHFKNRIASDLKIIYKA
ncbi:MAG: nucleotidyltransferase family protein [Saprospiraceae bacterium]